MFLSFPNPSPTSLFNLFLRPGLPSSSPGWSKTPYANKLASDSEISLSCFPGDGVRGVSDHVWPFPLFLVCSWEWTMWCWNTSASRMAWWCWGSRGGQKFPFHPLSCLLCGRFASVGRRRGYGYQATTKRWQLQVLPRGLLNLLNCLVLRQCLCSPSWPETHSVAPAGL